MTIQETINILKEKLLIHYLAPVNTNVANWILEHVCGYTKTELLMNIQKELDATELNKIFFIVDKHCQENMPLQYLFGTEKFLNLDISIKPPILIPRPETEEWVDALINKLTTLKDKKLTILDMCTGSGCIGLAIAKALPQATLYLSDISILACDLAKNNMQKNNITNTHIIQSDLFTQIPEDIKFDMLVTNPPYISYEDWQNLDPMVKQWEDFNALVAPDDGTGIIKKIIDSAKKYLKFNSELYESNIPQLIIEIGYNQGQQVANIAKNRNYYNVIVKKDFANKDRVVFASIQCGPDQKEEKL